MKFSTLRVLSITVAGGALIAGCTAGHPSASHPATTPASHPLASVPGYDRQAALTVLQQDGVPVHGTLSQQVTWARQLLTKGGRKAVARQLAIPQANRVPFENEAAADARKDHVAASHAGRVTFLETDLPSLLVKYGKK